MEHTDRGFGTTSGFISQYYGKVVVRESSNAMGPYLWIFTEKSPINGEKGEHIQLSLEEARMLRYDLDKMIAHLEESWEE